MKHGTGIGWTHVKHPEWGTLYKGETWNPVVAYRHGQPGWACEIASPGCVHCYAQMMNMRKPNGRGTGLDYKHGHLDELTFQLDRLDVPRRKKKQRCFFVMSMTDPFFSGHREPAPGHAATFIDFVATAMLAAPQHLYLFLTKHPEHLPGLISRMRAPRNCPRLMETVDAQQIVVPSTPSLSNIWFGCSVENQTWADKRRAAMQEVSAMGCTTFVSYEPALGPVDWSHWSVLDWIVMGGESGGEHVRAPHPRWFIDTIEWCVVNSVAPYFKQWGSFHPHPINAGIAGQFVSHDGQRRISTPLSSIPDARDLAFMRYSGPSSKSGGMNIQGGTVETWPYHQLPKPLHELTEVYNEPRRTANQKSLF